MVHQTLSQWRAADRLCGPATARLPEDRHIVWIAAKGRNVIMDPAKRLYLVMHPVVSTGPEFALRRKLRMREISENIQSVVDRYKNDSALTYGVPIKFDLVAVPGLDSAAVHPHHDRKPFISGLGGRPDIQVKTILAHGRRVISGRVEFLAVGCIGVGKSGLLNTGHPPCVALANAGPWLRFNRQPPAQIAHWRRGIRDALEERIPSLGQDTLHLAVFGNSIFQHY